MRRQLVPGPVVCLAVIKAKTRPGIEATLNHKTDNAIASLYRNYAAYMCFIQLM